MVKISALPSDTAPTGTDYFPTVDAETNQTKRVLLSDLNIYMRANDPYPTEGKFDYVASGGVWTADSAGVNKNASMTALVCYINGRRIAISAVTAKVFTASVDTYIDVLDNGDGTGTLVYTTAVNNAASAALASNSLRIGIIVTGATTIAAAGSVNQGEESKVLPIASSIPYAVTDSLGNLINPRDPNRRTLGYRQSLSSDTTVAGAAVKLFNILSCPVIVPTLRKIKIIVHCPQVSSSAGASVSFVSIWDGTVGSGTQLQEDVSQNNGANQGPPTETSIKTTPTSSSKTYNAGIRSTASAGAFTAAATTPAYITVELH